MKLYLTLILAVTLGLPTFAQNALVGNWSLSAARKIDLSTNTELMTEQTIFGAQPNIGFQVTPKLELQSKHFEEQNLRVSFEIVGEGQLLIKFAKTYAEGEARPTFNGSPMTESVTQTNFNYAVEGKTLRLYRQDPAYSDEFIFVRN